MDRSEIEDTVVIKTEVQDDLDLTCTDNILLDVDVKHEREITSFLNEHDYFINSQVDGVSVSVKCEFGHENDYRTISTVCNNKTLQSNFAIQDNSPKFVRKQCNFAAKCKETLIRHKSNVHEINEYKCDKREYIGHYEQYLKNRLNVHSAPNTFKCHKCDFVTVRECYLRQHVSVSLYELECDMCDYVTKIKCNLRSHRNVHTFEFKCDICDFVTKNKYCLKQHLNSRHGSNEFKCDKCKYVTKNKYYLKQHDNVCHSSNEFKCNKCKYVTKNKLYLKRHDNVHHGSNQFKCNKCIYVTKDKQNLKVHMNVHSSNEFKCDKCKYIAKYKALLRHHIIRCYSLTTFKCDSASM